MVALPDLSRILVVRYGRLGDLVLLIPALRALRRRFPSAHISVLVDQRYAAVPEMCSAVDKVIAFDRIGMRDSSWWSGAYSALRSAEVLRRARYDLVIDFHGFRETNLLAWYSRALWRIGLRRNEPSYLPFCFNLAPVPGRPESACSRSVRFPGGSPRGKSGDAEHWAGGSCRQPNHGGTVLAGKWDGGVPAPDRNVPGRQRGRQDVARRRDLQPWPTSWPTGVTWASSFSAGPARRTSSGKPSPP